MHRIVALLAAPLLGLAFVACGGNGESGSVQAFCERAQEMDDQDLDLDFDDPEAESAMADLLALAPNDEVRDALQTFLGLAEEFSALEEEDGEEAAFGAVFELLFDPEVIRAAQTLETFLEEECGIEPDDELELDDDLEFDLDGDFDPVNDDPLSGMSVRDAVEAAHPDVDVVSTGSYTIDGETVVTIGIELESADPMEVCETLVAYVDGVTGDDSVGVDITGPTGTDAAVERARGGSCVAA